MAPCPACACIIGNAPAGNSERVHALVAALRVDDIDRALELGLLDVSLACAGCSDACRATLADARLQREQALAARERYRARNARLERRQRERAARRKPVAASTGTPALPPAAAAALARAKARAAQRHDT